MTTKRSDIKVVAAISCLNEAKYISMVVSTALMYVDKVVVVDDGSTDETSQVAAKAGAQLVRHSRRLGAGAAARSCLQAGLDQGADVLITLDGDGQHNANEIPDVMEPVVQGNADLVIGSRFMGKANNVAAYRRFGIWVITTLYNVGASVTITDAQSGFRAYGRRALETLTITEDGFGFSVETLVEARRAGLRMIEAPISCLYHSESHSLNPVIHGVTVALDVVRQRMLTPNLYRNGYKVAPSQPSKLHE